MSFFIVLVAGMDLKLSTLNAKKIITLANSLNQTRLLKNRFLIGWWKMPIPHPLRDEIPRNEGNAALRFYSGPWASRTANGRFPTASTISLNRWLIKWPFKPVSTIPPHLWVIRHWSMKAAVLTNCSSSGLRSRFFRLKSRVCFPCEFQGLTDLYWRFWRVCLYLWG